MATKKVENFVMDRVFITEEKGNLCWTRYEITPDGQKSETEWIMYIEGTDPKMKDAVKWLKSIGRL